MVPRLEAKMIRLIGYSTPPAGLTPIRSAVISVIVHSLLSSPRSVVEELHRDRELVGLVSRARIGAVADGAAPASERNHSDQEQSCGLPNDGDREAQPVK